VRVDLPGVGTNLQDRYEVGVVNRLKFWSWKVLENATFTRGDPQFRQWTSARQGVYATNGVALAVTKRSDPSRPLPDLFFLGLLGNFQGYFPGYSKLLPTGLNDLTWCILRAHTDHTAGTVRLRSADPRDSACDQKARRKKRVRSKASASRASTACTGSSCENTYRRPVAGPRSWMGETSTYRSLVDPPGAGVAAGAGLGVGVCLALGKAGGLGTGGDARLGAGVVGLVSAGGRLFLICALFWPQHPMVRLSGFGLRKRLDDDRVVPCALQQGGCS